jgi:DNA-binding response OmpR family regulator
MRRLEIPATLGGWHALLSRRRQSTLPAGGSNTQREGFTVAGVATASADALRQTETLQPDVVLVDVVLGDESGWLARLVADHARGRDPDFDSL